MGRQKVKLSQIVADGSEGDVPVVTGGVLVYGAGGGGSATPTGPAGGVLSGTYPNPGFAVDMATQAELDAVDATIPVLASQLSTVFVPLVGTVGGVPQLIFDASDDLVLTEVPIP